MAEITLLENNEEYLFSEFIQNCNESMAFHTLNYLKMIKDFLTIRSLIIIAKENDNIVGALPIFIKENNKYGNIINSSPIYSSNGGLLVSRRLNYLEKIEIKKELLKKFNELVIEEDCVISTIITSSFDKEIIFYEDNLNYNYRNYRIGYIKELNNTVNTPAESIKYTVDRKCRGSINRSERNLELEISNDFTDFYKLHISTMKDKGGHKPMELFEKLKENLNENEYELSYAVMNGKRVGGDVVLYFKDKILWYATGVDLEYRSEQPTSFLLCNIMKRGMEKGFRYFDFGGTELPKMAGVASYKYSWGSNEYPYYYYTTIHQSIDDLLQLTPEEILSHYKWFYVIPFEKLKSI